MGLFCDNDRHYLACKAIYQINKWAWNIDLSRNYVLCEKRTLAERIGYQGQQSNIQFRGRYAKIWMQRWTNQSQVFQKAVTNNLIALSASSKRVILSALYNTFTFFKSVPQNPSNSAYKIPQNSVGACPSALKHLAMKESSVFKWCTNWK